MPFAPTALPRRLVTPLATVVLAAVAVTGCTSFGASSDDDDGAAPAQQPAVTVTIPPTRLTPFCQAMIDLADRLENDPPDDLEATIIDAYESIAAEVPAALREDFDAVLADLRGERLPEPPEPDADTAVSVPPSFDPGPPVTDATGATLPAGDPFFDEGYDPEETPALRLNAYVDFACRDVANNPGPPPTQPLSDVTTTVAE